MDTVPRNGSMDRLFQLTSKNLFGILNLVLVIVCAYVAARVVHNIRRQDPAMKTGAQLVQPIAPQVTPPRTFNAYQAILDRNLFKSNLTDAPPVPVVEEVPEEVDESPLQAKLIATIVSGDESRSTATIEDIRKHEKGIYHENEQLMVEATIVRIERERVIVLRNGKHEKLSLYDEEGGATAARPAAGRYSGLNPLQRRAAARGLLSPPRGLPAVKPQAKPRPQGAGKLKELSTFNSQNKDFRIMPRFDNGKVSGFRIFGLSATSNWAKSGLKNGDIVRAINGQEISSAQQMDEFLEDLKKPETILDVDRNNTKQSISNGGGS